MYSEVKRIISTSNCARGDGPEVLTHIYDDAINIALWQRALSNEVCSYVDQLLQSKRQISIKLSASTSQLMDEIQRVFPSVLMTANDNCISAAAFYADMHLVLDMFSSLFDAHTIGLRMNTLDKAMCPRFHKDNVSVRLVTTYAGPGTEWLSATDAIGHTRISGVGTAATPAFIFQPSAVQTTAAGTVALLKGEMWEGNEGRGIVHRSPTVTTAERRLLVTCDLL